MSKRFLLAYHKREIQVANKHMEGSQPHYLRVYCNLKLLSEPMPIRLTVIQKTDKMKFW